LKFDLQKDILSEVPASSLSALDTCRAEKKVALNTMFIEGHTPNIKYSLYGRVLMYNKHHLNIPDITCVDKETVTLA